MLEALKKNVLLVLGLALVISTLAALLVRGSAWAETPFDAVSFLSGVALCGIWVSSRRRQQQPTRAPTPPPLTDGMRDGLLLLDAEETYVHVNEAACGFLDRDSAELIGRDAHAVRHVLRMPLLLATDVLKHGSRPVVTGRFSMKGRTVSVEFSRAMSGDDYLGFAVLMRDITDQCEFSSNVVMADKMTALGELAAAMAHEINSPLGGVMESVRIIRKNTGQWEKVERFLPLVQQGLEQIAGTVRQMMKFATPQEAPRTRMVLEEVITQCVDFLQYRQTETQAELHLDLRTERTVVMASSHALSQVLLNLINNAFDAVNGRPGGAVEVATELLPASAEVAVHVRDNGPGVPDHLRARIFEPFFTTKASGKGTGLGLPISARIAARHGGRIVVSKRENGGAVFSLVLPLIGEYSEE